MLHNYPDWKKLLFCTFQVIQLKIICLFQVHHMPLTHIAQKLFSLKRLEFLI